MYVLGIWDGHDSGAALVDGKNIIYAANEERFTKRKLEVNFPYNSMQPRWSTRSSSRRDIEHIAFTTTEFTKTLERIFPGMKENYYLFRRRKMPEAQLREPEAQAEVHHDWLGILPLCNHDKQCQHPAASSGTMGFRNFKLHVVEHHTAHAATAAFTAPSRDRYHNS